MLEFRIVRRIGHEFPYASENMLTAGWMPRLGGTEFRELEIHSLAKMCFPGECEHSGSTSNIELKWRIVHAGRIFSV
jgi:hypothetical protein